MTEFEVGDRVQWIQDIGNKSLDLTGRVISVGAVECAVLANSFDTWLLFVTKEQLQHAQ